MNKSRAQKSQTSKKPTYKNCCLFLLCQTVSFTWLFRKFGQTPQRTPTGLSVCINSSSCQTVFVPDSSWAASSVFIFTGILLRTSFPRNWRNTEFEESKTSYSFSQPKTCSLESSTMANHSKYKSRKVLLKRQENNEKLILNVDHNAYLYFVSLSL